VLRYDRLEPANESGQMVEVVERERYIGRGCEVDV
jgi:hypothetical protein